MSGQDGLSKLVKAVLDQVLEVRSQMRWGRIGTNGTEERQGYRNGNRHAHCTRAEGMGNSGSGLQHFAQRGEQMLSQIILFQHIRSEDLPKCGICCKSPADTVSHCFAALIVEVDRIREVGRGTRDIVLTFDK